MKEVITMKKRNKKKAKGQEKKGSFSFSRNAVRNAPMRFTDVLPRPPSRMKLSQRLSVRYVTKHKMEKMFNTQNYRKAVLIAKDVPFPKTHNIRTLLDLLPEDINLPLKIKDGAILTDYAVTMHYPGNFEPIDEKEYQQSVRLAEAVVYWAEKIIHE